MIDDCRGRRRYRLWSQSFLRRLDELFQLSLLLFKEGLDCGVDFLHLLLGLGQILRPVLLVEPQQSLKFLLLLRAELQTPGVLSLLPRE